MNNLTLQQETIDELLKEVTSSNRLSSFTEYKGLIIVIKDCYYGQVYLFNDVEYKRFYEVAFAVDRWLESNNV